MCVVCVLTCEQYVCLCVCMCARVRVRVSWCVRVFIYIIHVGSLSAHAFARAHTMHTHTLIYARTHSHTHTHPHRWRSRATTSYWYRPLWWRALWPSWAFWPSRPSPIRIRFENDPNVSFDHDSTACFTARLVFGGVPSSLGGGIRGVDTRGQATAD